MESCWIHDGGESPFRSTSQPEWFHIGFRYETVEEVICLYERLRADGLDVGNLDKFDDYTQFRFPDPTGYTVEVFWEPRFLQALLP